VGATLVKQNLSPSAKGPLEKAGAAQDKFVQTLGDKIARELASIMENGGKEDMPRVAAAKALLEWIRPKNHGVSVNISNAPHYTSHLNLPAPEIPTESETIEVEAIEIQKVLPEPPRPMVEANMGVSPAKFEALRELQAEHAPEITKEQLNRAQSPSPRDPDQPLPASSVKMFQ
jgi:hypothetical protein